MGICLKELRETFVNIKIVDKANLTHEKTALEGLKSEVNELISIFVVSIKTAKGNIK